MQAEEKYKVYEGVRLDSLIHIPEASSYNYNHYIGLKREHKTCKDIIYAASDDDNTTDLYDISGGHVSQIGVCYTSEDNIIHTEWFD